MILMPGCTCCGGGGPPSQCPAESITVTLTNLPYANTSGDNYVTSNEGSFHLKKIFETPPDSSGDFVCRWEYKDIASGGTRNDYVVLRITLEHWTIEGRFGDTEELRLYVEMDAGELRWFKAATTVDPQNYTFTNSDLTSNSWAPAPAGMQAVTSAYDPTSQDQCDGYLPCVNWRDAATAEETCPLIMTVADAMDTTNYCGEPPTVFSQVVPDTSPPLYVEYAQGGTDSLDLTLPSTWHGTQYSYGTLAANWTINWGGGTHSLGWGGYDNVKAYVSSDYEPNSACGNWSPWHFYSEGWVSVIAGVTVTSVRVSDGNTISWNCLAIAQANITRNFLTTQYPARRIVLKIALLCAWPYPSTTIIGARADHSFAFASDGTLGEDAYSVGSFPTFTESNAGQQGAVCPISLAPVTYNYSYTLEQG